MCGIAGYFGPVPPSSERVDACLAVMGRRGPDARNFASLTLPGGSYACLLHSRLAIIDLDHRSDQPFRTGNGVLSYNGEIYNFPDLKARLAAEGERFSTDSDTEVLARALAHWGWQRTLEAAEGMWAFAWVDTTNGSMLLSRDRFGEKPLYLMRDAAGGLWFGSEVKFIAALSGRWPQPNFNHLKRYLVNGYKALYKTRETFFEGIEELPAGTVLELDAQGGKPSRYWSPSLTEDPQMGFDDAAARTRQGLIEAVGMRLRSDVPLAFCMSGGVDSNALISIARRVFDYDVHGFTILNTDVRYEEMSLVNASVRELGVRHTGILLEKGGFVENLRTLVRSHDGPVSTISYYVHWRLMAAVAAAGYKVSISGTGADELFSGYFDHHLFYLAAVAADPVRHAEAVREWETHVHPIVRNRYLQDPARFERDPLFRDHIFEDVGLYAALLNEPWSEGFAEERYHPLPLRNRMLNELFHEAVPVILHEDDLNAMFYSIENRSPFLDSQLFALAGSIPTRHLIRGGYAKAVLRESMRGIVPDAILDCHRKVGFNAPLLDLLDISAPEVRATLLADSPVWGVVRREAMLPWFDKQSLSNGESKFLFNFLNAKLFLEEFGA